MTELVAEHVNICPFFATRAHADERVLKADLPSARRGASESDVSEPTCQRAHADTIPLSSQSMHVPPQPQGTSFGAMRTARLPPVRVATMR